MRIVRLALLLALLCSWTAAADEADAHAPKLLLTAKLAKRLKRDRERQTPRWLNFENRVKTAVDSPERGFELALYYAVTGDAARANEAAAWALAHPGEIRQRALVLDWCGDAVSPEQRAALAAPVPISGGATYQARRDCLFANLAAGRKVESCAGGDLDVANLLVDSAELYAACEYFVTLRANGAEDQRREAPQFFQHLPVEFLLARRPQDVERPDWRSHVAALALVTLDPNLEASQFLQGWAIEDRQTLKDGPGVAYELLWADPYLPGIAYQNLDPWFYESGGGRLFARTDWTANACWVGISSKGVQDQGCPSGWKERTLNFGSLQLMPAAGKCIEIPHQEVKQNIIVWKLKPSEKLTYHDGKEIASQSDEAGMWHPGTNVDGKVCQAR